MSTTWSEDDLRRLAETDDLQISPFCENGKDRCTPTWIWSIVVDGELYVRSYKRRKVVTARAQTEGAPDYRRQEK
jgi:hypothetical protein